jgi:putative proteasome-type protease
MTYCVSIHVNEGVAFLSDSRTNAGVDQLSTYSKMFTFGVAGERAVVILTAGNLATTQAVIKSIRRDIDASAEENLFSIGVMDEVAAYVGRLNFEQQNKHVNQAAGNNLDISATFIVGGQIRGLGPEVYLVYPEGNFIAATEQTPYQQIGEVKYGKPILDRIITADTPLEEAALCGLVSMDSTMRSNATVGPPIEMLLYAQDSLVLGERTRYERDDAYFLSLRRAWERELTRGFKALPPLKLN